MRAFPILMAALATGVAACTGTGGQVRDTAMVQTIKEVQKEHAGRLMAVPGVVGIATGIDQDKPCLKVYVIKKTPELMRQIPRELGGYPVIIEETGEIRAMPERAL